MKAGLAATVNKYLSSISYEFILHDYQADACHQIIVFCSLANQRNYLSHPPRGIWKMCPFNFRSLLPINKIIEQGFKAS